MENAQNPQNSKFQWSTLNNFHFSYIINCLLFWIWKPRSLSQARLSKFLLCSTSVLTSTKLECFLSDTGRTIADKINNNHKCQNKYCKQKEKLKNRSFWRGATTNASRPRVRDVRTTPARANTPPFVLGYTPRRKRSTMNAFGGVNDQTWSNRDKNEQCDVMSTMENNPFKEHQERKYRRGMKMEIQKLCLEIDAHILNRAFSKDRNIPWQNKEQDAPPNAMKTTKRNKILNDGLHYLT